jgi:hypothetical protein
VTVDKRFTAEPPLDLVLSAIGMRVFSVGEFGGRVGNGLCAILALLAVYWAGLGLLRRRAAMLSTLALGSLPLFVLESRQIVSDMPLVAALALALGGFGRYAWPADGVRRMRDLMVACAGLGMGLLSGGALLGVVLPCLALAGSLLVGFGLRPRQEGAVNDALCAPGVGKMSPRTCFWPRALCARRARPRGAHRGGCLGHPALHPDPRHWQRGRQVLAAPRRRAAGRHAVDDLRFLRQAARLRPLSMERARRLRARPSARPPWAAATSPRAIDSPSSSSTFSSSPPLASPCRASSCS